ncbi:hypothetical protein FQN54_002376 [Arachnomyces sp. PD_36]|nr:hypothetical protein FQN54_002376 [Arachnomyces sp. PD_36]
MSEHGSTPRQSGIPRLAPISRLPLPTGTPSRSIRPSPSRERLQADRGLDVAKLRRPSEGNLFKKPPPRSSSPTKSRESSYSHVGGINQTPGGGSTGSGSIVEGETCDSSETSSDIYSVETPLNRKKPRPSLSDRTIETLSQIPPTPSPSRRKSSFFTNESPMRPPSRPASAMNDYSRPPSRQRQQEPFQARFSSSMRQPSVSRTPSVASTSRAPASQRSVSSFQETQRRSSGVNGRQSLGPEKLQNPKLKPPVKRGDVNGSIPAKIGANGGSKSLSAMSRYNRPRPSLSNAFVEPTPTEVKSSSKKDVLPVSKPRKPSSTFSSNLTSPASNGSKVSSETSTAEFNPPERSAPDPQPRKVSKSSSALRESIAKAKAARKSMRESGGGLIDPFDNVDIKDPFNQRPAEGSNSGLLKKRIQSARKSGHLNIAAMDLKEIPDEVMTMYDFDPNSSEDWYESVDLVKFIAADNELETLSDATFPDIDPNSDDLDEDSRGNQFGGLQVLDLHGNKLGSLPTGIRRLCRLNSLNLSNNRLKMEDIQIIKEVTSLTELKLANNSLEDMLMPEISCLTKLEVLDLRGNSLQSLPEGIADLRCLKVVNLAENQLASLPLEALKQLPVTELYAQKNNLRGTLIPGSVDRLESLQVLNVAGNALQKLSENDHLELPNLQQLSIDANRMKELPDMSSWKALLSLTADSNSIQALPETFLGLEKVKYVDLTGNDMSKIDERIGLMDSLTTFRVANNPLRERKFLTLDTHDLKRDLRNRCTPETPQIVEEEDSSVQTEFTLAPESPTGPNSWRVKAGGLLDCSSSELVDLNPADLEASRASSRDIRCMYLHHNRLRCVPVPALSLLTHTLTDLDLSKNPFDPSNPINIPITLPSLQNLNLSGNGLTSLESFQTNLTAPSLTFLDVSNNRLTGALPFIRYSYPSLITFVASDNQIQSLQFDAVQGLQVLDVSNNDIGHLPPKLGLLGGEGGSGKWPSLRRLEVAGNSFRVPRWQVVQKGTEALLEWLKNRIPTEELQAWEGGDEDVDSVLD